MIKIIQAITVSDKQYLLNKYPIEIADLNENSPFLFGFWEDDICVGISGISSKYKGGYVLILSTPSNFNMAKLLVEIWNELFKHYHAIYAVIDKKNIKSHKMAKQIGFVKIKSTEAEHIYIFTPKLWRYNKKWPINV